MGTHENILIDQHCLTALHFFCIFTILEAVDIPLQNAKAIYYVVTIQITQILQSLIRSLSGFFNPQDKSNQIINIHQPQKISLEFQSLRITEFNFLRKDVAKVVTNLITVKMMQLYFITIQQKYTIIHNPSLNHQKTSILLCQPSLSLCHRKSGYNVGY